eukprot:482373-Rhodomonas_salina.3
MRFQVTIDNDFKCTGDGCGVIGDRAPSSSSSSSSSDNTALIAGIAGGVGGVVVVGAAAALWMRSRKDDEQVMTAPVQTINIEDLKTQLAADC